MIIKIAEHQHLNNDYICDFCDEPGVVGKSYYESRDGIKNYLFSYCSKCGIEQAQKMAMLVHPDYKVIKKPKESK